MLSRSPTWTLAQENKEVYEGEVTELAPEETESAVSNTAAAAVPKCGVLTFSCGKVGGYDKVINHVVIGLKTMKGTKQLKLDPTIYDALQKEKVCCP